VAAAETPAFQQAERAHTSFLADAEKRALLWMAARIPAGVNSDHLTALGFTALVAAGACYAASRFTPYALLAVIPCLILNWLGVYIDHILDAVGSFFLMSGLALSGYMTPAVAYSFLIAYLLLSIEIYLATYSIGTFHLSYWRFGPTELRILLVIGNLAALWQPHSLIAGRSLLLFDVGFTIGAAALAVILVQATVAHGRRLYREETRR
jgi:archaetidylinositol phosphate synthase